MWNWSVIQKLSNKYLQYISQRYAWISSYDYQYIRFQCNPLNKCCNIYVSWTLSPQNLCQIITSLLCAWAPVSSLPMIPYIIPHYIGLHTTIWLPTSKSCEFLTCFPGVVPRTYIFIPCAFGIIEVRKLLLYNIVRRFLSHALGWIASEIETDNLVETYVLISAIFRALATWKATCLWSSVWQPSLLVASLQVRIMQNKNLTTAAHVVERG